MKKEEKEKKNGKTEKRKISISKRARALILLTAALAVVIGAFFFLKEGPLLKESDDSKSSDSSKTEISKFDKELLKSMQVASAGNTLRLYRENDEWQVEGADVRLDAGLIDDLAYSFASLYADDTVAENAEDLAIYGLDPPIATATAMLTDGTTLEFYLGNKTPAGNTYYLMARDDPKVYAVWMNHGSHFQYKLDDIRDRKLPEINYEEFIYLKIVHHGRTDMEVIRTEQNADDSEFSTSAYYMTAPYDPPEPVSMDKWPDFQSTIPAFKIEQFVDDNPTELSRYGLKNPSAEFIIKDTENALHLIFGDIRDNMVYFLLEGDRSVYAMDAKKIEFLDVKPFPLIDKFAFIVNIDDVDKIRITAPGRDYSLSMTRKQEREEGEEEITTYFLNGREVEEKPFKTLYQAIIAIFMDAEHQKRLAEKAEVTLEYSLNRGRIREYRVSFVPYDVDFYALFKNGKSGFLVSRSQIRNMLAALDDFVQENLNLN